MRVIVIANINATLQELRAQDRVVVDSISRFVEPNAPDLLVSYATSVQEIADAFGRNEPLVLFTNFPPDSTYEASHQPQVHAAYGGMVYSSPADSYSRVKAELGQLVPQYPSLRTWVITGAPRNVLTDAEITSITRVGTIRIVRKADLFNSPEGYENAYTSLLFNVVARSLKENPEVRRWRAVQLEWSKEQLGSTRVLVLAKREYVADALAQGLDSIFTDISCPLTFVKAATIEHAHALLLRGQLEIVLSVADSDYWLPIHQALEAQKSLVASVCLLNAGANSAVIPKRCVVIRTDVGGEADIRKLALGLLEVLRSANSRVASPEGLSILQREVLEHLAQDDSDALARALRVLTSRHQSVLRSLSTPENRLNLFIPVSTADDFEATLRKALFICDRAVFTQLPAAQSRTLEGDRVMIIPLWDFEGAQCGSMIQARMANVIRRYAPMFADGRTVFYPSPTMIHVSSKNVGEIMPEGDSFLHAHPEIPIWQECRAFEQYVSADKIGAAHVVLDHYRPMADVGRAIMEMEIPYVANVPPELLEKLLADNHQSLVAFRRHTRRVIDDLVESGSDVERSQVRKRFKRDIEDGVRELQSRIGLLKRSVAIQQSGGAILTAVSTLAAVSVLDIPAAAAKLIGSGGLGTMAFQYLSYLVQLRALSKSPYQIVWQLKQRGS